MPKIQKSIKLTQQFGGINAIVGGKSVTITNRNAASILLSRQLNALKKQVIQYGVNIDPTRGISSHLPNWSMGQKIIIPKELQASIMKSSDYKTMSKVAAPAINQAKQHVRAAKQEKRWQTQFSNYKVKHAKTKMTYDVFRMKKIQSNAEARKRAVKKKLEEIAGKGGFGGGPDFLPKGSGWQKGHSYYSPMDRAREVLYRYFDRYGIKFDESLYDEVLSRIAAECPVGQSEEFDLNRVIEIIEEVKNSRGVDYLDPSDPNNIVDNTEGSFMGGN